MNIRVCGKNASAGQPLDPPSQVALAEVNEMPLKRHGRTNGGVEKALRVP